MKKFHSPAKLTSGILSLICLTMTTAGIVLASIGTEQIELILMLFGFGIPMGILTLSVFIAASNTYLVIEHDKIVFPVTRAPKLKYRRGAVLFSDIKCVKTSFYKGDGIVALDSYMFTFILKNGLEFTENFRARYGKKQEQEIISALKEKIHFT